MVVASGGCTRAPPCRAALRASAAFRRTLPRPQSAACCTPPRAAQTEVKAAEGEAERLVAEGVFAAADVGLLHGQMDAGDKDAVLARFKAGQIKVLVRCGGALGLRPAVDVMGVGGREPRGALGGAGRHALVSAGSAEGGLAWPRSSSTRRPTLGSVASSRPRSTTVVEVGVDVPQATIMVVEHAGELDGGQRLMGRCCMRRTCAGRPSRSAPTPRPPSRPLARLPRQSALAWPSCTSCAGAWGAASGRATATWCTGVARRRSGAWRCAPAARGMG